MSARRASPYPRELLRVVRRAAILTGVAWSLYRRSRRNEGEMILTAKREMSTTSACEPVTEMPESRQSVLPRCACGAPMYEDLTHEKFAASHGFEQRRFYCRLDGRDLFEPRFGGSASTSYRRRSRSCRPRRGERPRT